MIEFRNHNLSAVPFGFFGLIAISPKNICHLTDSNQSDDHKTREQMVPVNFKYIRRDFIWFLAHPKAFQEKHREIAYLLLQLRLSGRSLMRFKESNTHYFHSDRSGLNPDLFCFLCDFPKIQNIFHNTNRHTSLVSTVVLVARTVCPEVSRPWLTTK